MGYKKNIPYLFEGFIVYYLGDDNDGDCWWKGCKKSLNGLSIGIFKVDHQIINRKERYDRALKRYNVPFTYSCEDFKIFDYFASGTFNADAEFEKPIKKTRLAKKLIKNIIAETEDYIWV